MDQLQATPRYNATKLLKLKTKVGFPYALSESKYHCYSEQSFDGDAIIDFDEP